VQVDAPILAMRSQFPLSVASRNVTYAEWTRLTSLQSSSKLYARKSDAEVDSAILDDLDRLHSEEQPL
jgi:hypothetical protein